MYNELEQHQNPSVTPSPNTFFIYYLLLQNNKYYLASFKTQLMEIHDILSISALNGPDWLLINRPIRILKVVQSHSSYIMKDYILDCMRTHGIHNVRGDTLNNMIISQKEETELLSQMETCYIPIPCGDYQEESDNSSRSSSRCSSMSISETNRSIYSKIKKWICFKKIENQETKERLL